MNALPKIIWEPTLVGNRLEQLGVTKEQMLEAAAAAVGERRNCTNFDPRSAPGWSSWRFGNRRLREILVPLDSGWEMDEADGVPSVINRGRKIKITMCNTDAGTGLKDYHPQQISKKGTAMEDAIHRNQLALPEILDKSLSQKIVRFSPTGLIACWYLCVYCEGDDVRVELSYPIECVDGFFKSFSERIFLTSDSDNGDGGVPVRKISPDGGDAGFEIPVLRKQAL